VGAFELAGNGTLFLDEVGELPLDIQPKLLRVLESGEFRRVGGNKVFKSKARVIAATKRNLKEEVARGKFREDLYFRLAVVPIVVPALRTHREDIPALIQHFLKLAQARDPRLAEVALSQQTIAGLSAHDWPGNVRELRNVLDRALYMAAASGESELQLVDFPVAPNGASNFFGNFDEAKSYRDIRTEVENEFEKHYVTWLLGRHDGNLSGAARAAKMDRKHLHDLARKHGLRGK
jgi:transcriptional regulator with GAF, ATPase, and Fis domain